MKKVICFIAFALVYFGSVAQTFPQNPTNGQVQINNTNLGAGTFNRGVRGGVFVDTSAANDVPYMKGTKFMLISTTSDNNYWYRSADTMRWELIATTTSNCAGTQLISGSITWSGSGLVYDATDLDYYILCSRYFANSTTLTLATADPTYGRIDKFYADNTQNIGVITGTPSANPQEPSVNPLTQIDLGFVYIPAGSTVPAGTTQTVIYNENVEWSGTSNVPSVNFTYGTNPYIGSVSTYLPSAPNSSYVEWQSNGTDYLFSEAQYLKFWVRLNANFSTEPLSFLDVTFEYTDVTVSQTLSVGNGDYNMDYDLINQWQLVSIPLTGITTFGTDFNSVHFVINSAPTSFQLDYVYLLETATVPPAPVGGTWLLNGNSAINDVTQYIGTRDAKKLNIGTNGQIRAYIDTAGIELLLDDTTANVMLIDSNGKIWKTYQPTILADSPLVIYTDVYQKHIKADTTDANPEALATQYDLTQISGGGVPFGYTFSTTQPTDTSVGWINANYNILQCYPVQYHVNGQWNEVDTIGGQFYDAVGKVFSRGYPYKIIATGQSNLGGPYIGEVANPNAPPYNGYYGDTIPAPGVAAWDNISNKWVIAKIRATPFQYSSGANYLLLAAKKINERTGRSVRIVTYPDGGKGLEHWAGVPGTPPQDSTGYIEFKSRVQSSGLIHPDVFIWAQSESGISPVPTNTTYFDKWKEMVDTMIARDHLMDTTTLKILMASGDTLSNSNNAYTMGNGTSAGEGALRALAATNDRTIKYIDAISYQTQLSDALHFLPKGHEELAIRLYNSIMEGQKNPSRDMMGFGGVSPWKFSSTHQQLAATGLNFVNNAGKTFLNFEGGTSNTIYTGGNANSSNQYSPGLVFNPIDNNVVTLTHYNGTTRIQLEDTRILSSNIAVAPYIEVFSGANPYISLKDITTNKDWKIYNDNFTNTMRIAYDGASRWGVKKTGEFGIGTYTADSLLQVMGGIYNTGGVRFSGLPTSGTFSKALGVTSNGTLYLKDTLAVSGVYAPLNSPTLVTPVLGAASATSLTINGTAGNGFVKYLTQSSAPSTPASGFSLYADASNRFAWKGANGFVRTFDGTANTANRDYTLPDASGTIALTSSSITGSAATLTTPRLINGVSFNGSADISTDIFLKAYQALGSTIVAQNVDGTLSEANSSLTMISQRSYWALVYVPVATTITGVKWKQVTAGNYTANNYNGVGLYSISGGTLTLVASSTDDGNIWKTTSGTIGSKAFSSTYAASAGVYMVAALHSSSANTTSPVIGMLTGLSGFVNTTWDFTNSAKSSGLISSLTALPSPTQAFSGMAASTSEAWFGLY